jgi:hypothetical protein
MAESGTYDQATITRRQKIAEQMLAESSRPQPIRHWAQGLAQLGNIGADVFTLNRLDKQAGEARKADTAALMSILNGGGAAPTPSAVASPSPAPAMPPPSPTVIGANGPAKPDAQGVYDSNAVMLPQQQPDFGKAIAGIETGGKYDAMGPVTKTGDQAYGKYQVMGANIPEWTRMHVGREMSPQEFLASPEAQDAVFKGQFGKYASAYGPEGAARAWFAGEGGMNDPGRTDQLGTSVKSYGDQFTKNMGGPGAVAAAMSPSAALPSPSSPAPSAPAPAAPGALPTNQPTGIPDQQRRAIAALMMATPGSPAQQLGLQLSAQSLKPHDYQHQTLPDGTILQVDPTGKQPPKVVYQGPTKPQFTQIGEDILGNKKFGFVDSTTRKVSDVAGNPIGAGGTGTGSTDIPKGPDGNPLSGQDLLKHLEKNDPLAAAGVKGIIAGDMNAGGRNLQKLLPLAKLVDPSMEQFDYQARSKTRVNYTSGPGAQEVKAINTAIGHADQLATISPKLGGVDVMPGVLNPLIQGTRRNLGDKEFQDAKRDWDAKAETLATEVSKALNGGQPHVADKEHWRQILQGASSPTERTAALKSVMGILESRLSANANTYNQGMGTTREGLTFLTPENKDRYDRLLKTGGAAPEAKPAAATGPSRDEIEAEMKRRGLAP